MLEISNWQKLHGKRIKVAGVDLTITDVGMTEHSDAYVFYDKVADYVFYLGREMYSNGLYSVHLVDNATGDWIGVGVEVYWLENMSEFIEWLGCAIWYKEENGVAVPYGSMDDAKSGRVAKVLRY
jgi:hypothetical protein